MLYTALRDMRRAEVGPAIVHDERNAPVQGRFFIRRNVLEARVGIEHISRFENM